MGETTGYDSTTVSDLPDGGDWYAGYTDGWYANMAALAARFPTVPNVSISAVGRIPGEVLDVEPSCVWPVQAAVLRVREWRAQGIEPVCYVGLSNFGSLFDEFNAFGDAQPDYWTAHYGKGPHICQYPVCSGYRVPKQPIVTQWGGDVPGHYDVNLATEIPGEGSQHTDTHGGLVPINSKTRSLTEVGMFILLATSDAGNDAPYAVGPGYARGLSDEEYQQSLGIPGIGVYDVRNNLRQRDVVLSAWNNGNQA